MADRLERNHQVFGVRPKNQAGSVILEPSSVLEAITRGHVDLQADESLNFFSNLLTCLLPVLLNVEGIND